MLERFQRKHRIVSGKKPSSEWIEANYSFFPKYLIDIWQEFGFFKTEDSFLFFENPNNFNFLIEIGILNKNQRVFCRTSFGDLFYWDSESCYLVMINEGKIWQYDTKLELFFESTLQRDQTLEGVLEYKYHKKAVKKLGFLEPDECFAFVPAFALGGSAQTSEIEKVKLREHLLFLSQLTGKPESVNLSVSSEAIDGLIDAYDRENP